MTKIRTSIFGLVAGATLGFGVTSASADGPSPGGRVYAPVSQATSWSGFYLGLQAGGAWGDIDTINLTDTHFHTAIGQVDQFSPSGYLIGGQVGVNYQMGAWVIGAEVSFADGFVDDTIVRPGPFSPNRLKLEFGDLFTATAKLGYASNRWLVYAKGGFASAEIDTFATEIPFFNHSVDSSKRHSGYVLGAGVEYALTRNWSFGVEYNYIDLGAETHTGQANAAPNNYSVRVDPDALHSVMARLNVRP